MIDTQTIMIVIILSAVALGSVLYGLWALKVNVLNPSGKGAERGTARLLKKFALIRGFRVFSNVKFTYKGTEHFIENMLIGYFGILLVFTLGGRGEYYGQMDGKTWSRVMNAKKETFPNLAALQDEAMVALRGVFSQYKVYSVPMEGVITLTSKAKKTQMHISNEGRIFLPGKLRPYLHRTKFEKDAGADVAKIAEIIGEINLNKK